MRKILFNDKYGLTDAVLRGRKTMMRRIIPLTDTDREYLNTAFDWDLRERVIIDRYAKYKVGEVVAVAQSYKDLKLSYIPHIDEPDFKTCTKHAPRWGNPRGMKGWSNKMFVRADLMPYRIIITNIKVERLQDISDEDIMKEGITYIAGGGYGVRFGKNYNTFASNPMVAFAVLIDNISGKGTWERNPYVFAYTFELVK